METGDKAVKQAALIGAARKAAKGAHIDSKNRVEADHIREVAWNRRAQMAGRPLTEFKASVRSIRKRRADRRLAVQLQRKVAMALKNHSSSGTVNDNEGAQK